MLSEKAKGKRRAVDTSETGEPSGEASNGHEIITRQLIIRFTEGLPDLQLEIGKQSTVRDVKTAVGIFYFFRGR